MYLGGMVVLIAIFCIPEDRYWRDDDGQLLLYQTEAAAKNMMFDEGWSYEYVSTAVEFHPKYFETPDI